jgi:transposase
MGAGRKSRIEWRHTEAELSKAYRDCPDKASGTRAMALLLVRRGHTRRQAAAQLGASARALSEWLRLYRERGLEAVLALRHGGHWQKRPRLSERARRVLVRLSRQGKLRTARDAVAAVEAEDGLRYSESGMRRRLRKLSMRKKVPRPRHGKADHARQRAWKKGG